MPQLLGKQQPPSPPLRTPSSTGGGRGSGPAPVPPAPAPALGCRGSPEPCPALPAPHLSHSKHPKAAAAPGRHRRLLWRVQSPQPPLSPWAPGPLRPAQREGAGEAPERGPWVELPRSAALPTAPGPLWSGHQAPHQPPEPWWGAGALESSRPWSTPQSQEHPLLTPLSPTARTHHSPWPSTPR